jgi:Lrp/AsnC family transcriptional regulator
VIDRTDRRILQYLQQNADMPITELADRIGLSKNPCWRRVQKLQQAGIIKKTVALLDARKLNVGVTVFVNIRINTHSADWLQRFARVINDIPEVVEFYRMSGNVDYLLKVVVPTVEAYDVVYKKMIGEIEIFDVSSYFAMEEIKNTTELPLDYTHYRRT